MADFDKKKFSEYVQLKFGNYENFKNAYNARFGLDKSINTIKAWGKPSTPNAPSRKEMPNVALMLDLDVQELYEGNDISQVDILKSYLKNPSEKIREVLGISKKINDNTLLIPMKDILAGAGAGGFIDYDIDHIPTLGIQTIHVDFLPKDCILQNLIGVRISGRSMEPLMNEGDSLLIELTKGAVLEPSDDYYLIEFDGLLQVKYIAFIDSKNIQIISENPKIQAITYNREEDQRSFEILGKVVAHIKSYGSLSSIIKN